MAATPSALTILPEVLGQTTRYIHQNRANTHFSTKYRGDCHPGTDPCFPIACRSRRLLFDVSKRLYSSLRRPRPHATIFGFHPKHADVPFIAPDPYSPKHRTTHCSTPKPLRCIRLFGPIPFPFPTATSRSCVPPVSVQAHCHQRPQPIPRPTTPVFLRPPATFPRTGSGFRGLRVTVCSQPPGP